MLKRQIARAKLAEDKKKWKRAIVPSEAESAVKRSKILESASNDSEGDRSPVMKSANSPTNAIIRANPIIPSMPTSFVGKVRCLYSYTAMRPDEINFKEGDLISVVEKRPSGWWIGALNGRCGLFPSNYTAKVPDENNGVSPPLPPSTAKVAASNGATNGRVDSGSTAENGAGSIATPQQTADILHTLKRLNDGKTKAAPSSGSSMAQHYEDVVRQLLLELDQVKMKCQEQDEKIQKLEKEKRDSIKELVYVKAVLESSLNYKAEEEDALAGLEALQTLHSLL